MSRSTGVAMPSSPRIGRLMAQAVCALEQATGHPLPDREAVERAVSNGGPLETRIVVRACNLEISPRLESALHRVQTLLGWVLLLVVLVAFTSGAAAVAAALATAPSNQPVNIFLILLGVLGAQSLLLMFWLIVMALRPPGALSGSLGSAILKLGQWLIGRVHSDAPHLAATRALAADAHGTGAMRWTISSISHLAWFAFNLGALAGLLLLLSMRHYLFGWETTILDARAYPLLIDAMGALPHALGFDKPTPDQINASQWTGVLVEDGFESSRRAWASLLIGSVVAYGLMPRFGLLFFCWVVSIWKRTRGRIDVNHPGMAALRDRLMPPAQTLGVLDPDREGLPALRHDSSVAHLAHIPRIGRPAILGIEMAHVDDWPPHAASFDWLNLGVITDRATEELALQRLSQNQHAISQLIVVCALPASPDRGVLRLLRSLATTGIPLRLILTSGQLLRQRLRSQEVALRVRDWRDIAAQVGIAASDILEIDLDHLTDASTIQLRRWTAAEPPDAEPASRLKQSFDLITQHAERWKDVPSLAEQAELHRAISLLYRRETSTWKSMLHLPEHLSQEPIEDLKAAAARMTELLPLSLKQSSRWIATGATAGVLACVAAATMVFPAAITALPLWAAIGGGLGGLLRTIRSQSHLAPAVASTAVNVQDAVDAAVLFALVLELQGRGEAEIARVLDATFDAADTRELAPTQVRAYLAEVSHCLDMALARLADGPTA